MLTAAGGTAIHLLCYHLLLELFQECMDNGGWVHVLYKVRGGIDKLSFI
jgi:hypothetical protein